MQEVGIPREARFALEGHASSDVGDSYGSDGYPLSVLADAITKIPNPLRTAEQRVDGQPRRSSEQAKGELHTFAPRGS